MDWQKKESARAGMRKMIKRLLKKQSFVNANNGRIMMIQNLFIRKPRRNMSFLKAVHTP
nr:MULTISPECIES: type I restriction enzyme endonuclease domain-containing protein [Bacteroides]